MKTAAWLLALLALAGCDRRDPADAPIRDGMRQTLFPGMVTAGGHTSGEVFAAAARSGSVEPGPAGTPGIPKGAGGNVGGTSLGGTTAGTSPAPAAGVSAGATATASAPQTLASAAVPPASAASATPATAVAALPPASGASTVSVLPATPGIKDADRQARELSLSTDLVAARWRARAAASGLPVHAATAVAAAAPGARAPLATGPVNVRSEKIGNVAPTPDAKTAVKPFDPGRVQDNAPKAAGARP